MNICLQWIIFLSTLLISFFAFSEDNSNLQKSEGGRISIVFTDTNVYRRTLDSAPAIGSGMEDYSIEIGCMGRSDCLAKVKSTYALVSTKGRIVKSCKKPIYARITINPGSIAYGEENQTDVYDIDHTGKCVNHLGSSYKIEKSVFEILNTKAIFKW